MRVTVRCLNGKESAEQLCLFVDKAKKTIIPGLGLKWGADCIQIFRNVMTDHVLESFDEAIDAHGATKAGLEKALKVVAANCFGPHSARDAKVHLETLAKEEEPNTKQTFSA